MIIDDKAKVSFCLEYHQNSSRSPIAFNLGPSTVFVRISTIFVSLSYLAIWVVVWVVFLQFFSGSEVWITTPVVYCKIRLWDPRHRSKHASFKLQPLYEINDNAWRTKAEARCFPSVLLFWDAALRFTGLTLNCKRKWHPYMSDTSPIPGMISIHEAGNNHGFPCWFKYKWWNGLFGIRKKSLQSAFTNLAWSFCHLLASKTMGECALI